MNHRALAYLLGQWTALRPATQRAVLEAEDRGCITNAYYFIDVDTSIAREMRDCFRRRADRHGMEGRLCTVAASSISNRLYVAWCSASCPVWDTGFGHPTSFETPDASSCRVPIAARRRPIDASSSTVLARTAHVVPSVAASPASHPLRARHPLEQVDLVRRIGRPENGTGRAAAHPQRWLVQLKLPTGQLTARRVDRRPRRLTSDLDTSSPNGN